MTFKLSCADFTFPLLPHDRVLELIAMLELDGVDIGLFEKRSHLQPSTEFADLQQSASRLKGRLDKAGLEVFDVFLLMDPELDAYAINHPDPGRCEHARNWFLKTLAYTSTLGDQHVTTTPGMYFAGVDRLACCFDSTGQSEALRHWLPSAEASPVAPMT